MVSRTCKRFEQALACPLIVRVKCNLCSNRTQTASSAVVIA